MSVEQEKSKQYSEVAISDILRSMVSTARFLISKWWQLAIIGLIFGLAGYIYALYSKPSYRSRLTFALEESGGALGGALSLAAEFGLNIGSGKDIFQGDNIMEIFTSRRIIERVLLSEDTINNKVVTFADNYIAIQKDKIKSKSPLNLVSFPVGQNRNNFTYLQDSVLYLLYADIAKNALSVKKPDKKLNIYEIQFTSPQERFTKVFTDKIVSETIDFYTELRSKRSKQTLEVLENRVADIKGSLNSSITSRTSTQDENINPAFNKAQAPLQKRQFEIQAYGSAYGELFKNLELARYQYLKDIPLLQIIDDSNFPMERIKTRKLTAAITFSFTAVFLFSIFILIRRKLDSYKKSKI